MKVWLESHGWESWSLSQCPDMNQFTNPCRKTLRHWNNVFLCILKEIYSHLSEKLRVEEKLWALLTTDFKLHKPLRLRISLWVLLEISGQVELASVCLQWVPVSMYVFSTIVISLVPEGIVVTDKFGCWQIPQNNCLIRGVKAIMGRRAKTLEFAPLTKKVMYKQFCTSGWTATHILK